MLNYLRGIAFNMNIPSNLYKYLTFNENTLQLMCLQQSYYSDPVNFNDPLDCQPEIINDLEMEELRDLVGKLVISRATKQLSLNVNALRLKTEQFDSWVQHLTETELYNFHARLNYDAGEYKLSKDYFINQYVEFIQDDLKSTFKRGVLCLSSKFNSPLLWSHYANQHRGLCIEYDMVDINETEIHKVIYGGSRELKTSQIKNWFETNSHQQLIEKVCLLTKSEEWRYESEWRMFGPIGLYNSVQPIKSIIFGLKCSETTIYTVIRALSMNSKKIKFWKIFNEKGTFKLKRHLIDAEGYCNNMHIPLSVSEIRKIFSGIALC